ncbi:MAG: Ig-like domain-containing protein [Bacteroidia bacterium]|nr:Ig-like domain-containing protein [Bacteroidia bacterium]
MDDLKKMNPKIISAVDLTHLQPGERVKIIGNENLKSRREFLVKLVKAGIMVGVPMIFAQSCEPEIIYKPTEEEDCPAYTPCTSQQACSCNTDATASIPPKVVKTVPVKGSSFSLDPSGVEIRIDIDKAMDSSSIASALVLTPAVSGGFDIHFYDFSKNKTGFKTSLALFKPGTSQKLSLLPDTAYTITLKGTARDINGKYLDGNSDGTGGDDFSFNFTTIKRYDSCICQSDCSCVGYSCSCQSYTCTCVSFYCDCQFAGCPLYRI